MENRRHPTLSSSSSSRTQDYLGPTSLTPGTLPSESEWASEQSLSIRRVYTCTHICICVCGHDGRYHVVYMLCPCCVRVCARVYMCCVHVPVCVRVGPRVCTYTYCVYMCVCEHMCTCTRRVGCVSRRRSLRNPAPGREEVPTTHARGVTLSGALTVSSTKIQPSVPDPPRPTRRRVTEKG